MQLVVIVYVNKFVDTSQTKTRYGFHCEASQCEPDCVNRLKKLNVATIVWQTLFRFVVPIMHWGTAERTV